MKEYIGSCGTRFAQTVLALIPNIPSCLGRVRRRGTKLEMHGGTLQGRLVWEDLSGLQRFSESYSEDAIGAIESVCSISSADSES